jgi:integrase
MVVFMFVFGCRASTAIRLRASDIEVSTERITAVLVHRKGKRTQDPLVLHYARSPTAVFEDSPLALLRRWALLRPAADAFFLLAEEAALAPVAASHAVNLLAGSVSLFAPAGCSYSSHSVRIGAYNEWMAMGFPTPWIMHRMGWESDAMLRVYYDPRITVTDDSGWFFDHLRPRA